MLFCVYSGYLCPTSAPNDLLVCECEKNAKTDEICEDTLSLHYINSCVRLHKRAFCISHAALPQSGLSAFIPQD